MLTAIEKDRIISARGEKVITGIRSQKYTVVLKDRQCTVLSSNGDDKDKVASDCAKTFGDNFVRLE